MSWGILYKSCQENICVLSTPMHAPLLTLIKLSRTTSSKSATCPMLPQIFACIDGYIYANRAYYASVKKTGVNACPYPLLSFLDVWVLIYFSILYLIGVLHCTIVMVQGHWVEHEGSPQPSSGQSWDQRSLRYIATTFKASSTSVVEKVENLQ